MRSVIPHRFRVWLHWDSMARSMDKPWGLLSWREQQNWGPHGPEPCDSCLALFMPAGIRELCAHLMNVIYVAIIRIIEFTKRPSSYASRTLIPSGPQSVNAWSKEGARSSMNCVHRRPGSFDSMLIIPAPGGIYVNGLSKRLCIPITPLPLVLQPSLISFCDKF